MIAPGVAAGGYPGAVEYLPFAAALAVQNGAVHHAEAQALAIAHGELLEADRLFNAFNGCRILHTGLQRASLDCSSGVTVLAGLVIALHGYQYCCRVMAP